MNNHPLAKGRATHFTLISIFTEAWSLVHGLKWPVFLFVFTIPIVYFIAVVAAILILIPRSLLLSIPFFIFLSCFSCVILWCSASFITVLSVRHVIGLSVNIKHTYTQCMKVKDKLFYLFLIWLSMIGFYIFLNFFFMPNGVIGFILQIILCAFLFYIKLPLMIFATPLLITKHCDLTSAIEESYQAMNRHWLPIIACYVIMIFIIMISAIPFGVGLIWTMPMYYAMTGIIFRDVYGLKKRL